MELAALLWGSAFTLLALYCLAASRIALWILRRYFTKVPDPVDFTLPTDGVFPQSSARAEVKADIPRRTTPGMKIGFEISLIWLGRESLLLRTDLVGGRNRKTIDFSPPYRGSYLGREAHITVRDLLGFTRSFVLIALTERLRVYPSVQPEQSRRPPSQEGGEEEKKKRRRRRSEELLEIRKYFPGDDIRKVHWKVFAHTSELFLRIGEETPPPESRFLVILDAAPSPAVPDRVAADYLDGLVERCAAAVLEMVGRGFQVFFATSESGAPREIKLEKNRELLGFLAGLWWSERYALELPGQRYRQVLLYSSPGSANLSRLLSALETRGWNVQLFLQGLSAPEQKAAGQGLRYLVQRPPVVEERSPVLIGPEELRAFREVLNQEVSRWTRKGKRKVFVETI
jgi:uncharacterized protein (DUF58 family)